MEAAGLRDGMRVLDLGSGAGDMSFVVADIVGDSGEVVGIDAAPAIPATPLASQALSWRSQRRPRERSAWHGRTFASSFATFTTQ
jgi:tRNA A58 N-methylase Trm61